MPVVSAHPDRLRFFERIIFPFAVVISVICVFRAERFLFTLNLVTAWLIWNLIASAVRYRSNPVWTPRIELCRALVNSSFTFVVVVLEGALDPAFLFLIPGVVWASLAVRPRILSYLVILWYIFSYAAASYSGGHDWRDLFLPLVTLISFAGFSTAVVITMEGVVDDSLGKVIGTLPYSIFTTDIDGIILRMNRGVLTVPVENAIGSNFMEYVPPAEHARVRGIIDQVRAGKTPAQYEIEVPSNGETACLLVHAAPILVERRVSGFVFSVVDITSRKSEEKALTHALSEAAAATRAKSEFIAVVITNCGLRSTPYSPAWKFLVPRDPN